MNLRLATAALVFSVLNLLSCSTPPPQKSKPVVAPYDAKKELSQIQIDVAAGSDKRAVQRLKNLIAKHPSSDVADDATLQLAKIYYGKGQFEAAYQTFMSLVNSAYFSANEGEALLGATRSLHKLGRLDEGLGLSARGLKIAGLSESTRLDFHKVRFQIQSALNERFDALLSLAYVREHDTRADVKGNAQTRSLDLVNRALTEGDLEKVLETPELAYVHAPAALRLALIHMQNHDFDGARRYFAVAADKGQGTSVETQAKQYLGQLDSRRKLDPYAIGAVLPLSGKHAPVGQRTLRGLQLGLGIYGDARTPLKLAVVDSENGAEGATRGVDRLIGEDNVIAIAGSLLSRNAQAVAMRSQEMGVPSIALSQKSGVTEAGSFTFRNAVTAEMQVRELVRLAMEKHGYKRFAILYPNDSYGVEYANIFWDEVAARGGTITASQIYGPQETDFRGPIRRLVGTYYVEDRKAEYEARVRNWFKKQKSLKSRNSPPDDLLPPIVDFDAIFIPDSPKAVGQIAPMLAYQSVGKVRLLGTNLWNSPELVRRGQKNVEDALFVDSTLSNDPNFKNSRFAADFKKVFGEDPGLFEAQGYEVGMMLRQLILGDSQTTRVGLAQGLAELKNFQGISGPMSMSAQREMVHPLFAFTVQKGEIVDAR